MSHQGNMLRFTDSHAFAVRVSLSFGNGCYGIGGHDKYQCLHLVRSWICTWRQPTTRTKYMVNVRSSISHCQISFRHPFQVYGKCSFQRTKYPIAKYHYVTLSITQSPTLLTLHHPFHHLKSYPIDTPSPFPSLKVLSHWQPINSQTLRPVHSRIQNISLPNIILSPFPSLKFLSQQQPTNVLFQWLESDMEEGMWVLFVTDDAVNTARI